MNTRIITRRCEISHSIQDRAGELLGRLDRFDPRITEVVVTFEEQRHLKRVDAIVKVLGDEPVVAHAEGEEFREALDTLTNRLTKILRRRRSKMVDRQGPNLSEAVAQTELD